MSFQNVSLAPCDADEWGAAGRGECARKQFADGQHGVHAFGKLEGYGDRATLEAEPFAHSQNGCTQIGRALPQVSSDVAAC